MAETFKEDIELTKDINQQEKRAVDGGFRINKYVSGYSFKRSLL